MDDDAERLTTLDSRVYSVGPWRIHARVAATGDRPSILLVHGIAVSSRYMVPLAMHLAPSLDVYAPDLPGIGRSSKPRHALQLPELADCLVEFADATVIERAVFVGNSFGCQIAAEVAVRHPERVRALVLQGPTVDPHARSWPRQVLRWITDGPREPQGIHLAATLVRDYIDCGPRRALELFRYALRDPIEKKLGRIDAPAVVVRGSHDPIVPQQWAEEVATLLPRGRLVVVPGPAHTVNFEIGRAHV